MDLPRTLSSVLRPPCGTPDIHVCVPEHDPLGPVPPVPQAAMTAMSQANVYSVLMDQVLEQSVGRGFVPRKEGPAGG